MFTRKAVLGAVAALVAAPLTFLALSSPASAAPTTCRLTPKSVVLGDQPRKVTFQLASPFDEWQVQTNELGLSISESSAVQVLDAASCTAARWAGIS